MDEQRYIDISTHQLNNVEPRMEQYPSGYSNWAQAMLAHVFPWYEIAITGPKALDLRRILDQVRTEPHVPGDHGNEHIATARGEDPGGRHDHLRLREQGLPHARWHCGRSDADDGMRLAAVISVLLPCVLYAQALRVEPGTDDPDDLRFNEAFIQRNGITSIEGQGNVRR